jgi:hypothetical protein
LEKVIKEHIETARNYINSAEHLDTLNIANDTVYNELLKRAKTQLIMAELYIDNNQD